MIFRFKLTVLVVVATGLFVLTGALPARADWVDTFDGGFDQAWTFGAVDNAIVPVGIVPEPGATLSIGVESDQLVFSDTVAWSDGGSRYATGSVDDVLGDLTMTAVLNPNGGASDNRMYVVARSSGGGTGYAAGVNFRNNELHIFDMGGGVLVELNLANEGWTPASSVYLEFDLIGNVLTTRAYDAAGDSSPRAELTFTDLDNLYSSGNSGVYTLVGRSGTMNATYDNITATSLVTIPEPSSAALIAALGGAMSLRRRRR